jgi:hypothetical protein
VVGSWRADGQASAVENKGRWWLDGVGGACRLDYGTWHDVHLTGQEPVLPWLSFVFETAPPCNQLPALHRKSIFRTHSIPL